MIVLFTDFGLEGPYTGQVKAVLAQQAPGVPVIDLFSDLAPFAPRAAAYLLAAYCEEFPAGTVFLCVVDPGVGTDRRALVVEAGGRRFVGPDNGLLAIAARRAPDARWSELTERPQRLSNSFHGRDWFAPAAARLATGKPLPTKEIDAASIAGSDWPDDLAEIVYIDRYGNAMTGLRAACVPPDTVIEVGAHRVRHARVFAEAPPGTPFWYENANGLVELAVNQGRVDEVLGLRVGTRVARSDLSERSAPG